MKVDSRIYKGIAYVQFNELPEAQQAKLMESAGRDFFIKILIDDKIVAQCIQYSDYSMWYDNTYAPQKLAATKETVVTPAQVNISTDLAFNKI